MSKIVTFLQEVRAELRKIVWPRRDDLVGSTVIVCLLALVFAVILGFMDSSFSTVIKKIISS